MMKKILWGVIVMGIAFTKGIAEESTTPQDNSAQPINSQTTKEAINMDSVRLSDNSISFPMF